VVQLIAHYRIKCNTFTFDTIHASMEVLSSIGSAYFRLEFQKSTFIFVFLDYFFWWMYRGRRQALAYEALLLFWMWSCSRWSTIYYEGRKTELY